MPHTVECLCFLFYPSVDGAFVTHQNYVIKYLIIICVKCVASLDSCQDKIDDKQTVNEFISARCMHNAHCSLLIQPTNK